MPVSFEKEPQMISPEKQVDSELLGRFEHDAGRKTLDLTVGLEGIETETSYSLKRMSPDGALKLVTNPNTGGSIDLMKRFDRRISNPGDVLDAVDGLTPLTDGQKEQRSAVSLAFLRNTPLGLSAPVPAGSEGREAFDNTQRDRRMFEAGATGGSSKMESYATELFVGTLNPEFVSRIAENLDGKTVFNLGGGNAKISAELAEHGAHTEVVNVEPYPSEQLEQATPEEGYDHLLKENPASPDFFEKSELPEHSVDEVWAVYSVPAYLGTAGEVSTLFDNMTRLVKPGGIVRISHLGSVDAKAGDARIAAIHASLEAAKDKGFLIETSKSSRGITLLMTAPEQAAA